MKNHRVATRVCPGCLIKKEFDARSECCTSDCSYAYRARKAAAASAAEAKVVPAGPLEASLVVALKKAKGRVSIDSLSESLDRAPGTIKAALEALKTQGYNVELLPGSVVTLDSAVKPGNGPVLVHDVKDYNDGWHTFGACGDNHLGSKHERLDVLNALYDLYEDSGVTTVYNTGNWIEGEMRLNHHDIKVFGLDGQIEYFCENYPQRKGITTYFVAGDDHEGWYQRNERLEIGRYAERIAVDGGRHDLKYMGYVEADVKLQAKNGYSMMRIMHPGGGSAYALSYAAQKLVESFQGGEKPHVLLYGHYHKFDYNYAREVHAIGTGCTVDQSIFMRKCKIAAHVGGTMIRLNQAPDGTINRLQVEWIPFYDRNFYTNSKRHFGLLKKDRPIMVSPTGPLAKAA